jgi:hypothetical protein
MKRALFALAALFAVTLAVLAVPHLSKEAAGVVVGVVCGVGASIPVSLGLLLVLGRLPGLHAPTYAPPPVPPFANDVDRGTGRPTFTIREVPPASPPLRPARTAGLHVIRGGHP